LPTAGFQDAQLRSLFFNGLNILLRTSTPLCADRRQSEQQLAAQGAQSLYLDVRSGAVNVHTVSETYCRTTLPSHL
jgi:hypothetical protein